METPFVEVRFSPVAFVRAVFVLLSVQYLLGFYERRRKGSRNSFSGHTIEPQSALCCVCMTRTELGESGMKGASSHELAIGPQGKCIPPCTIGRI